MLGRVCACGCMSGRPPSTGTGVPAPPPARAPFHDERGGGRGDGSCRRHVVHWRLSRRAYCPQIPYSTRVVILTVRQVDDNPPPFVLFAVIATAMMICWVLRWMKRIVLGDCSRRICEKRDTRKHCAPTTHVITQRCNKLHTSYPAKHWSIVRRCRKLVVLAAVASVACKSPGG